MVGEKNIYIFLIYDKSNKDDNEPDGIDTNDDNNK